MRPGIDYDPVADLYDGYVPVTADIPFFIDEAARTDGLVLELMAGTGRVSIPLIEAGVPLTCVDYSRRMLERLRTKLEAGGLPVRAVRADARALPFAQRFSLCLLPFNSFAELVEEADQLAALRSIRAALVPGGAFVCTLHDPAVRARSLDGVMREVGRFTHPAGAGEIVLRSRLKLDPASRIASGVQILEERSGDGALLGERRMEMRFALPTRAGFEARARSAGFTVDELIGDYDRAPYEEGASPYMIWRLRRREFA